MKLLLVDDDALVLRLMKSSLGNRFQVITASSASEALARLEKGIDLAIIDLDLEEKMKGLTLIDPLKKAGIKTVVVSSHEDERIIDKCYEAGCDLYYSKGIIANSIHEIVNDLLLKDKVELSEEVFQKDYVTTSPKLISDIQRTFKSLLQSAHVLINGETGTGKSELAKIFHRESKVTGEFVAINCAGIPKELLESELFGHTKGAFTGADKAKVGKLKLADQGILFLDEINSMPLEMQAKLLKAVEEKKFYPVGSERTVESQFRLIAASNENLFQMVSEGRFRLDLLQRLCGTMLELTSLRDRPEDIFAQIRHFNQTQRKIFLTPDVKQLVHSYKWSGNTREIKRFVEFCLGLSGGRVETGDFEVFVKTGQFENNFTTTDISFWVQRSITEGLDAVTDEFRSMIIEEVLKRRKENVTNVMKELKISTRQFYKYIGPKKQREKHEYQLQ